jgi:Secretion system C-terminal sorting domain/Palmitoyl protein thioesterase
MNLITLKKHILYALVLCYFNFSGQSQTPTPPEPRFKTFQTGQAFTSITSDANKNVWAGTTSQGIFFLDQTVQNPTFSTQVLGTAPVIGGLRIQSMAKDKSGNIWIGHGGTNFSNGSGGVERVNVTTREVQHLSPDRDFRGIGFFPRDGIATLNAQQVMIDPNNKVWIAHRYHDLTVLGDGINPSQYFITPGTFSTRDAAATGPFESFNTWNDRNGVQIGGLPYPAYTLNPTGSQNAGTRTCNAISADRGFVYVSVFGYNAMVSITNNNTHIYKQPRLLKYTNTEVPQLIKEYTTQDARFNTSGGIFHGVYSNKNKGVWVTTPAAGNGFSVWRPTSSDINSGEGLWYNVTDPSIVPPGTIFNKGAIWGDSTGRVFMGTNKGIIVYNGSGEVFSPYAYTLFTKDAYDSPLLRAVHDPTMLSNNITAGCIESESTEEFSWIATPDGIMRLNLPIGDIYVYHVDDKEQPFKEKINGKENYEKMANLLSTHIAIQYSWGIDKEIPSFAVDGTKSSVLRLKTDDPGGYYAQNSIYKIELRKNTSDQLPGDPNSQQYIDRYGKLTLKPLADYEGQPQVQDLKYVDFIYEHPKYIEGTDFVQNKHYTEYDIFVFKKNLQQTDEPKFRHPIRLCLPPVLFGHGVWSNVASLQQFEDYFKSRGYTEYETAKAWRPNGEVAENHFYRDADKIPKYIKGLIKKAIDGKVSSGKVNVIVHSRGGLYTRAYIEEIKPDIPYKNDINALVTLNTPHFGSQTANGILDKRILLSGLQKTILLATILPQPLSNLSISNEINYGPTEPLRIGDLFSVAAPKADRENHYGAKNLTVENDYISGALDASTWFVPKLNSPAYRNKMQGIPFHAVATNFSLCQLEPILCNGSLALSGAIFALPKKIFWIKLLLSATNFALNTLPQGADAFLNYIYNGPSDAIVPRASMRANLADQFVSTFDGQNVCHVDTGNFLNSSGVTTNAEIQGSIFLKLKQKFNLQNSNTNFTKEGITAPLGLNYTFLAGFQGQTLRQANNTVNNSKVLIHPNSFIPELKSGVNTTFDVYQENVDKIMIEITSNKDENNTFFYEREVNLEFKNTFTFQVPANIFGNIKITAYGFKEGKMTAIHELDKTIQLPANITLQSIKFAENVVEISEKNQHRFKLLGMYSDNVEREINDLAGVTYTIENNLIISRTDSEVIKTNIPGQSKLTANIGSLTTTSRYDVVEDIALKQTIIADYFAEYQQTGPIKLNWKSLIEYNSNKFILEKSTDNITFTEINQQNGQGISYDDISYSYIDNTTDNIVYYKLKATDTFNTEVYNQTIQVNRSPLSINDAKFNTNKLILSPNPLTENTGTLSVYSALNDDNASLNIYNISGKLIYTKQCSIISNTEQKITFEMPSGASNGIYLVQLKTKEFSKTVKLVLQQ